MAACQSNLVQKMGKSPGVKITQHHNNPPPQKNCDNDPASLTTSETTNCFPAVVPIGQLLNQQKFFFFFQEGQKYTKFYSKAQIF